MVLVILGVIVFIASFVLMGLHQQTSDRTNLKPLAWVARVIGVIMILGGSLVGSVVIVPAGHRAVLMRFGAVQGQLGEGMSVIMPGVNTYQLMEVRTQKEESEASAASRDLQTVTTNLALNFRIDPSKVAEIFAEVGLEYKARIIDPVVQESIKEVTAQYTAEELIKLRPQVKAKVEEVMSRRLSAYHIIVEPGGLSITNFDFSPEFKKAIEEKQVAQQTAEKQKYVLQQAELEKQTEITRAQGKAQAAKLNAEALKVQGGGLVVAREWIEKWNGTLPQVSGGGGQGFMLDISKLISTGP